MKKFLIGLLIVILVPILGIIAFLSFADFNNYKPQIEGLARKYANLDVKINGDLKVGISLKPTIQLNDVTIANEETSAKIADIGHADVKFSLLPLLKKQIMIDSVYTTKTDIYTSDKDSITINELSVEMADQESPINIGFNTKVSGIDIFGDAVLSSIKSIQSSNFNDIDINTRINAMGYKLVYDGQLRDIQEKLQANGTYDIIRNENKISGTLNVNMENDRPYIKLDGTSSALNINSLMPEASKQAQNSWFISNAYAEEYIKGTTIPYEYLTMVDGEITIDIKKLIVSPEITVTNLKGDANVKNGVFKANIKNADTKGININGSVSVDSPKNLPYIKLNIKGDTLNIDDFTGNKKTPSAPVKKSSLSEYFIGSAQASELIKNTVIPYQYLKMVNADINANIKKITSGDIVLTNVNVDSNLKNGVFKSNIKNITAGSGTINGNITVNANSQSAAANISGKNIILQQLDKAFSDANNKQLYVKSGGKTTFDIKVNTSGKNTDQYLANMNGQIVSFIDPSVMRIKSLNALQGNIIAQILQAVKINLTNGDLNLKCAVVRGDISGGTVKFPKGIAINADNFYLVADGKINLSNDKINLDLQPFSGKITDVNISSILGNLIKVTGTINKPSIGINQTATAKNVIGAIATGGVYNAGDLFLSADSSPCHTALSGTTYAEHFPKEKSVQSTVSGGYTTTQDTIKGIGKGIKNQAKDIKNQLKGLFK